MIDNNSDENQNNYYVDEELSQILNGDASDYENSDRMQRYLKKSQYQRTVRKKSMMFIRLRRLLRFVLTLCILYLTYRLMIASRWYLPKDTITSYKIKRIQIVGNRITPTYKIITSISDIELPHKPIYMINTTEFTKKISSLSPIKRVYVKRLWNPARIVVYVEEREPIITIAPSPDVMPVAFYTKDGVLIGRDYLPLPQEYSPILVLSYGNSDDYTKWDKEKVLNIEKLIRTIEKSSGEKVEYVDMRKPNDVFVKLTSTSIRLGEIDSTTYHRIKDLKSILAKTHSFEEKIKYIDLSWEESKYIKLGGSDDKKEDVKDDAKENSDSTNQ